VRVDPSQLEQLVLNLIVNARDAMPGGGALTVETSEVLLGPGPRPDDAADVPPGRWVRISVEDTGHGMDAATRARMFEPFFTTKPIGEGSGLGLAAAHGIVQGAGGAIGVRTAPGRGTRVSVFLPRADGEPVVRVARHGARDLGGRGETVLLVEDEPQVLALAARALERRGYVVLTAPDGASALRVAEAALERVDLLVTDVAMPDLDGRALARQLRERRPSLPVLFISGYTAASPAELEAPLLAKPFTPAALAARVRELLDAARSSARAAP
jgi:CheY-like chemotaxis protein